MGNKKYIVVLQKPQKMKTVIPNILQIGLLQEEEYFPFLKTV